MVKSLSYVAETFGSRNRAYTAVEEVLIIQKIFAKFFGPRMFFRS